MLSVHTASTHCKASMRSVSEEEARKQKEVRRRKGRQGGGRGGRGKEVKMENQTEKERK